MKKITFLFALLCASVMGWAINWDSYSWIGNGSGNAAYTDAMKIDLPSGIGVVNLQSSFGTEAGIYITTPSAAGLTCDLGAGHFATQGAGMLLYLSAFTMQETPVTVTSGGTDYIVTVYWKDGEPEDLTGWNIAKGKTSVAGHNAQGGHAAANDGKFNTRWSSEGGQHYAAVGDAAEDWWYVDLGNFYTVNTIKILFETACPNDYDILISNNGASWTVIGTYTTSPNTGSNPDTDYNEYSFTDKVGRYVKIFARNGYNNMQYGFSMYEFEVYGERATLGDHNPPTMTSAALSGDAEWNQVHLAVAGTDTEDGTVTSFHVTDATHGVDQTCSATAGIITVTDLSGETTYNLNVKAVDAAGNESEEGIVVNVTTPVDTSVPLVAAPTPSGTNKEVVHIYSDAFPSTDGHSSCLAHDFDKDGFAGVALMQEKNISGDKCLIYNIAGAAEVTWGMYDDGNNAIIASDSYHHESYKGIDATEMEYLHIDIWSLQACSNINIQINDVSLNTKRSHNGNGWNSYDIPLTDYTFGDTEHTRRANVRFMKFNGLASITGKMALDNIYFWKTAAGLKSVSATPNNPTMGTATVKQNSVDVTEVTTGSTVTFNAVANDGYIFVNWSNNDTRATFDAEVNANMNLTANFRALNHISCNEEMTNGDYTVYVTYRKTANENEYEFIVRSAKEMTGFSNAYIGKINGDNQVNLNGQGTLSGNGHKLSYTFTSTTEPKLNTPLYVNFANHGEVTFNQINGNTVFEFAVPCADPEITAIALDKTEATLDMGNSLTLVPTFTPAYMSADIEWLTSDDAVATVANGVVTPIAPGTATITAKISETVKATCAITVQASTSHNWYGYGTSQDLDYTYRIEYTTDHHIVAHVKRQGNKTGLVNAQMLISGAWTNISETEGEEDGWKKGTTAATFTAGDDIHILIQSAYAGPTSIIEFDYEVGSDNVMPVIVPSVLKLNTNALSMGVDDDDIQLTAEIHHRDAANPTIIWTSDNENVATVVNGLVHPVGVGSATITAKCQADENVLATCAVTVVGVVEPATFWGNGYDNGVSIAYSITRNTNHTLTYAVEVMQNKADFGVQVNDGQYHTATLNEGIYTWTSTATYTDGDVFNGFFYMPFNNGAARVDFSYTIGSESVRKYIPITLKDDDNDFVISASDNVIREAKLNRTFPNTDEWYTLCLPFDLSDEQLTDVFGAGYTIAEMVGAEDRGSLIHLNFDYAPAFTAGKAYLLRPGTGVTTPPTFNGVVVKNVNPATVKSANAYMEFQGTFNQITLDQDNQRFVGPENYLYSPAANGTTMKAFRCYFTIPANAQNNVMGKRAKIVFGPQQATDIDQIENGQSVNAKIMIDGVLYIIRDGKTYNAQGQRIQ